MIFRMNSMDLPLLVSVVICDLLVPRNILPKLMRFSAKAATGAFSTWLELNLEKSSVM